MGKWEMVRLGMLLDAQPKSKVKAGDGSNTGDYKFFTSSNTQSKYISTCQYKGPALIFGTGGNPSVHYCGEPFSTSTDCIVFYGKDKNNLQLVYRFLQSNIHLLEEGFKGIGLKHISKPYILNIDIPLPPLEVQRKIAETLDAASELLAMRKNQLAELDKLIQSVFYGMFGDPKDNSYNLPIAKLGELCKVGSSKRIYQSEQTETGVPFLRISDLVQRIETGNQTAELFISETNYEKLKLAGMTPIQNDILVTSRGTLGSCYVVKADDKFYFQDGMISWLHDMSKRLNSTYLFYLFKTQGFKSQIDVNPTGTTVNYLSIARLKELKVMCPNVALQTQFAETVQKIEDQKALVQKAIDETQALFDSLMNEYFE